MKHRYFLLCCFLFVFVFAMFFVCAFFTNPIASVRFFDEKCKLSLNLYFDKTDGVHYLFVPSHESSGDISVHYPSSITVLFDNEPIPSSSTLSSSIGGGCSFSTISLSIRTILRKKSYLLCLCCCEGLETVWVQTEHGSMAHVDSDKSVKEKVSLSVFDESGNETYSGKAKISGRGNSTWSQVKKPYNLKFSEKVSLLGFEDVTKLCLLANFYDESGLKNPLGYYVAKEKGIKYTSDYRPINLFIDGDYKGLYGVVTKQEYEKHIEEDGIQAVFEFVRSTNPKKYTTKNGTCVRFYYGDVEKALQKIDVFETALFDKNYNVALECIDIDSFVNKMCFEEFFVDWDMTVLNSQYFCIGSDGKIQCINAWDFDAILGDNFAFYSKVENEMAVYIHRPTDKYWYRYLIEDINIREYMIKTLQRDYSKNTCDKITNFWNNYILNTNNSWECNKRLFYNNRKRFVSLADTLNEYCMLYMPILYNRTDFLISFLSNPEEYSIVNLSLRNRFSNICVPREENLSNNIDRYRQIQQPQSSNDMPIIWQTQDGKSIDDIKEVTENLVFYGKERNIYQNTLFMKLRNNALLLVSLGLVCLFFLLFVVREFCFRFN